ncbi:MAG: hypothetical protein QM664_13605 [Flavihumibacter sp.]
MKARVVDGSGNPLVHVPVNVRPAGRLMGSGFDRFDYTDANGCVSGAVFANASLELDVLTTCQAAAFTYAFNTQATNLDLGDIRGISASPSLVSWAVPGPATSL